jgi:hypothetical protein
LRRKLLLILFNHGRHYHRSFHAARIWRVRHCHVTRGVCVCLCVCVGVCVCVCVCVCKCVYVAPFHPAPIEKSPPLPAFPSHSQTHMFPAPALSRSLVVLSCLPRIYARMFFSNIHFCIWLSCSLLCPAAYIPSYTPVQRVVCKFSTRKSVSKFSIQTSLDITGYKDNSL